MEQREVDTGQDVSSLVRQIKTRKNVSIQSAIELANPSVLYFKAHVSNSRPGPQIRPPIELNVALSTLENYIKIYIFSSVCVHLDNI